MITKTHLTETRHISKSENVLFATSGDFCLIFKEDMKNLYLLSLLLTADPDKAEQCFVSGLDDCATGNQVFKEWARSWARRAVIKNAIRLIAPEPVAANRASIPVVGDKARPELHAQFSALFDLQPFERFAFVMSVLEGYSDRDCALLLGCTRESLIAARGRALLQVARGDQQPGAALKPLPGNRASGFELKIPASLATSA
jgi:hypothetical protein